jgi:16S rRNA (uracil1498-N3)-methyltransferase
MDRFFVGKESLRGEEVILKGQQAHQISKVLRKKAGEHIIVLDNLGWEYEIELKTIAKEKITGQIKNKCKAVGEPAVEITLYQSLLSREKFEWVLQKCTEVGVIRFVPVITERSIVRKESRKENKTQRWQRIIQEAAEQSGRGKIPQLDQTVNFKEAISNSAMPSRAGSPCYDCDYKFMAHTQAEGKSLRQCLKSSVKKIKSVALFIGPEGGFTENEVQRAKDCGIVPISLGRRILRTETAAVVASGLILYELGEMDGIATKSRRN